MKRPVVAMIVALSLTAVTLSLIAANFGEKQENVDIGTYRSQADCPDSAPLPPTRWQPRIPLADPLSEQRPLKLQPQRSRPASKA